MVAHEKVKCNRDNSTSLVTTFLLFIAQFLNPLGVVTQFDFIAIYATLRIFLKFKIIIYEGVSVYMKFAKKEILLQYALQNS